jgi:hypothetical protein
MLSPRTIGLPRAASLAEQLSAFIMSGWLVLRKSGRDGSNMGFRSSGVMPSADFTDFNSYFWIALSMGLRPLPSTVTLAKGKTGQQRFGQRIRILSQCRIVHHFCIQELRVRRLIAPLVGKHIERGHGLGHGRNRDYRASP